MFVYSISSPGIPFIYGSINYALQSLSLSYGRLLTIIVNRFSFGNSVLSFHSLTEAEVMAYNVEPPKDTQLRTTIQVFDRNGEIQTYTNSNGTSFTTFTSGRHFCMHFGLHGKLGRTIIQSGLFGEFTLVVVLVSNRLPVYLFDAVTLQLITTLPSFASAMKHAKVGFSTLKLLIANGSPHKGYIYSYSNNLCG